MLSFCRTTSRTPVRTPSGIVNLPEALPFASDMIVPVSEPFTVDPVGVMFTRRPSNVRYKLLDIGCKFSAVKEISLERIYSIADSRTVVATSVRVPVRPTSLSCAKLRPMSHCWFPSRSKLSTRYCRSLCLVVVRLCLHHLSIRTVLVVSLLTVTFFSSIQLSADGVSFKVPSLLYTAYGLTFIASVAKGCEISLVSV
ncbi:hypothetical protein BSP10_236 [Bacillus phage BSP10]|nr:hypothetical protein BSP9_233 [Bacillus phage BSP9]AUO79639.1 hypothetical protein BSP10_236 [Bacillus phage BSP10]AYJ75562.1 hypothetical protein BSP21_227 [Bacillus phage BSP21]